MNINWHRIKYENLLVAFLSVKICMVTGYLFQR